MTPGRDVHGFEASAAVAAEMLLSSASVLVIGHIDADGITAASIADFALDRAKIPREIMFVKKLDALEVNRAAAHPAEKVWFVDLGSGALSSLDSERFIITDHHQVDLGGRSERKGHVNPHMFGIDGSSEVSGAGVTYAVAKRMGPNNDDLAALAVVGAVGDYQESAEGRLAGYNRTILGDAIASGQITAEKDVRLFGRQTRPVHALLQYSSEPSLMPFITGERVKTDAAFVDPVDEEGEKMAVIDFLEELGIVLVKDGSFRTWCQLGLVEKRTIVSALVERILDSGKGLPLVRRLIGEAYTLTPNLPGAPLGWLTGLEEGAPKDSNGFAWRPSARALLDAKEFSTLLNACGRHERADVGLQICLGNREGALCIALEQQDDHRRRLREALDLVRISPSHMARTVTKEGVELKAVRYFHGGSEIGDTIVGIVAGMLLSSRNFPTDRPLIAFAQSGDGTCTVKVSGRGTKDLVRRGMDLAQAMRSAAEIAGGNGGGHNIAAGATVPEGREEEFLLAIDDIISAQMGPSV